MDKKLKLRLIESGYDPTYAQEVTMGKAGELIRDDVYRGNRDYPGGMILFDGWAQAIVRTGLGHSIMQKPAIAITSGDAGRGLYIYSAYDDANEERSSVFIGRKDASYSAEMPIKKISDNSKNTLDLYVLSDVPDSPAAKVEVFKRDDTTVLYLLPTDIVTRDKLFWGYIAEQFGLKLTEIDSQYKGKSPQTPWYTAKDEQSGTDLTFGTRFRVYAVRAGFPTEKSAEDLKRIVDGLNVNPQTVDGSWVGNNISTGGKTLETHIFKGRGNQVVAYMANLLKSK